MDPLRDARELLLALYAEDPEGLLRLLEAQMSLSYARRYLSRRGTVEEIVEGAVVLLDARGLLHDETRDALLRAHPGRAGWIQERWAQLGGERQAEPDPERQAEPDTDRQAQPDTDRPAQPDPERRALPEEPPPPEVPNSDAPSQDQWVTWELSRANDGRARLSSTHRSSGHYEDDLVEQDKEKMLQELGADCFGAPKSRKAALSAFAQHASACFPRGNSQLSSAQTLLVTPSEAPKLWLHLELKLLNGWSTLPLEAMWRPMGKGDALALRHKTTITRVQGTSADLRPPEDHPKLLLIEATVENDDAVTAAVEAVTTAWDAPRHARGERRAIRHVRGATWETLKSALRGLGPDSQDRTPFSVAHFIMHGGPGALVLELAPERRVNGRAGTLGAIVHAEAVSLLLKDLVSDAVVFSVCHSGAPAARQAQDSPFPESWSSVIESMIQQGIPNAIGSTATLSRDDAVDLCESWHATYLETGCPFQATTAARYRLRLSSELAWAHLIHVSSRPLSWTRGR